MGKYHLYLFRLVFSATALFFIADRILVWMGFRNDSVRSIFFVHPRVFWKLVLGKHWLGWSRTYVIWAEASISFLCFSGALFAITIEEIEPLGWILVSIVRGVDFCSWLFCLPPSVYSN